MTRLAPFTRTASDLDTFEDVLRRIEAAEMIRLCSLSLIPSFTSTSRAARAIR